MTSIVPALITFIGMVCCVYADLSPSETQALKQDAEHLFHEANALAKTNPVEGRKQFKRAALRYERLIREGNIKNGSLYYNAGNAYIKAGMIGEAILNYRLAEQYLPNDQGVRQNLEFARQARQDNIEDKKNDQLWKKVFFWHTLTSFHQRWTLFIGAFVLFWLVATIQLFYRPSFSSALLKVSGTIWSILALSLFYESVFQKAPLQGVVIESEVIARQGDSESYEASFRDPLHAGVEFTVLERRSGWEYIKLIDDRTCWLPSKSIALIKESNE